MFSAAVNAARDLEPAPWRQPECFREVSRHVALIRKTRGRSGVSERGASEQHAAHRIEAPHRQITVRARAVEGAKVVRQTPAIAARRRFKFDERDDARAVHVQIVARAPRREEIAFRTACGRAGNSGNRMRQFDEGIALFKRFKPIADVLQQCRGCRRKARIGRHAAFEERQRAPAEHVLKKRGFHVDHPVPKPFVGTRLTIVSLVGMQHHRVACQAVSQAAPIVETLDASERATNRIGIVAVHGIRLAVKPRFDAFDTFYRLGAPYPVGA